MEKCHVTGSQLKEVLLDKQRKIGHLLQSIPSDRWSYQPGGYAEVVLDDHTRITAHAVDGLINTYSLISLRVTWPSGEQGCLGACSVEELRLPKFAGN